MSPSSRSSVATKFLLPIFFCWKIHESTGFVLITNPSIAIPGPVVAAKTFRTGHGKRFAAAGEAEESVADADGENDSSGSRSGSKEEESPPPSSEPMLEMDNATVRIDDGGSNMTDRFKYKVHALMGDYDPTEGVADDEDQDGNIMKALITFPTQHVFDVVGRVSSSCDDGDSNDGYADRVKKIVFETTGDENIECDIVPRGKKFVKVRCKAMVESTTMINNIYDELGEMESTVMKF